MQKLKDVTVDEPLIAKTRRRFDYFIPNYLQHHVRESDTIVSIGCGIGYDVQLLCERGYNAYGFDPGVRSEVWNTYPGALRERLRVGYAEDLPFGLERFDFAYALEVIEHVGCQHGGWELLPEAAEIRRRFFESCLDMLKPGGRLLVSTSNRLCPIDVGHAHHYNKLNDIASKQAGINLTTPWDKRNFVWSLGDVARTISASKYGGKCTIEALSSLGYPSQSSSLGPGIFRRCASQAFLKWVNLPVWRSSLLNPILVLMITKAVSLGRQRPPRVGLPVQGAAA